MELRRHGRKEPSKETITNPSKSEYQELGNKEIESIENSTTDGSHLLPSPQEQLYPTSYSPSASYLTSMGMTFTSTIPSYSTMSQASISYPTNSFFSTATNPSASTNKSLLMPMMSAQMIPLVMKMQNSSGGQVSQQPTAQQFQQQTTVQPSTNDAQQERHIEEHMLATTGQHLYGMDKYKLEESNKRKRGRPSKKDNTSEYYMKPTEITMESLGNTPPTATTNEYTNEQSKRQQQNENLQHVLGSNTQQSTKNLPYFQFLEPSVGTKSNPNNANANGNDLTMMTNLPIANPSTTQFPANTMTNAMEILMNSLEGSQQPNRKKQRSTGKPRGRPRTRPRPGEVISRPRLQTIAPATITLQSVRDNNYMHQPLYSQPITMNPTDMHALPMRNTNEESNSMPTTSSNNNNGNGNNVIDDDVSILC